jgi:CheY-like chemotaxis protein
VAKTKILLVDDTELVLEQGKNFLKFSGVEILTAANGIEALEQVRREHPDLIFMDMNMPAMDGISCCTLLKADPFLCRIPIVMLTSAGRDGDRDRALKAGCDDYLTKPLDRRQFMDKARKFTSSVERRERRMPCSFPVICQLGKTLFGAEVVNISEGGVFIATTQQIQKDKLIRVALYLPAANPVLMELLGTVAWLNEDGKWASIKLPAGFGLTFQDLEERETATLNMYLDELR